MKAIVAAIHGILNSQTDPTWPDKLDAWMYHNAPQVKVVKKEYRAGAWPRLNVLFKNPRLAKALANELMLLQDGALNVPVWIFAHSNGCFIAMRCAAIMLSQGYQVRGIVLIGAACPADVRSNGVLDIVKRPPGSRPTTIVAWSNGGDHTVPFTMTAEEKAAASWTKRLKHWLWCKLAWPYGGLGHEGFRIKSEEFSCPANPVVYTRPFPSTYGHSGYWAAENINSSFADLLALVKKG